MSAAPARRRSEVKGKIKTGICENNNYTNPNTDETGPCPKCVSGEKIKVEVKRISDFRCPVCGEKLTPVKDGLLKWIWIASGVVAAVVALVLCFCLPKGGGEENVVSTDTAKNAIDTTSVQPLEEPETDSLTVSISESEGTVENKVKERPSVANQSNSRSVLGGTATMTVSGGYTTIKFNTTYYLDMGDVDHSTTTINPGDEIYMANIRNGVLYGGQLKRANGEEVAIHGIKVRL